MQLCEIGPSVKIHQWYRPAETEVICTQPSCRFQHARQL